VGPRGLEYRVGKLAPFLMFSHFFLLRDLCDRTASRFKRDREGSLHDTSSENVVQFRPKALLLCGWMWPAQSVNGGMASSATSPGALDGHLLPERRLRFFPIAPAPLICLVVALETSPFKLLHWGRTFH
jgi:hypothetical protein